MNSKNTRTVHVATFALLALAGGGCSQHTPSDAQTTAVAAATVAAEPAAGAAQPATAAAGPASTASAAQIAAAPADAAVASSEGDQAGTKFVVNSLVRGSDTLTLKFTLVNDSSKVLGTWGRFDASGYHGDRTMSGIHLIDAVARKKYFPIVDTDGNCICSQDVDDIAPQSQTPLWVKFPAPPPGVTKIGIEVPHFIPLDNVPITQ
jgi:hypothetical protein